MMLLPVVAWAAVKIDGIWYYLVIKEAEVTNRWGGSSDGWGSYKGSVTIPATVTYDGVEYSVTSIGTYAFYYCYGLTSIEIPNSILSIGNYAFIGCTGLTSITIPSSISSIENSTFYGCTGLTSITIPNSISRIENSTFYGCTGLTSITIPSSISSIEPSTFSGCTGLTSITIPSSISRIENATFSGCTGLTSITIPSSIKSIEHYAFSGCSGLTSVTIGSGVKEIYSQAFASCKELTDVYCHAEKVPSTYTDAFQNSYINYATLHVPAASINDYKTTEPWKNFKNFMTIEEEQLPKCYTPTIAFDKDGLVFNCETPGVDIAYEITDSDIKKGFANNSKMSLTPVYTITYYATKAGYKNSDLATATIR